MIIRDILEGGGGDSIVAVSSTMPLLEAAGKLQACDYSALVVVVNDALVGVFSERTLVNAVASRGPGIALMTVGEAMGPALLTCTLDDDVGEMLDLMGAAGVHHVPVMQDGVPITMLTARQFEAACHYLKAQAETDDLTGLANRRSLMPEIGRELERYSRTRAPMAIAMLDLDLLKRINDKLGHAAGDALLRLISRVMARETRSCDTVARIGGDEFAILFPQTRLHEAVIACNRVLKACSRLPLPRIDGIYMVTLSIGVTIAQRGDTVETILQRADDGLYQAKASGRGRVFAVRTSATDHPARRLTEPEDALLTSVPASVDAAGDQGLLFSASN